MLEKIYVAIFFIVVFVYIYIYLINASSTFGVNVIFIKNTCLILLFKLLA